MAALVCLRAEPATAAPPGQGGHSFVERFKTLDRSRWFVSDGWAGGPDAACALAARNVHLNSRAEKNGAEKPSVELALTATPYRDRPYTCAELQTHAFHGFGTYEVRMRAAAGGGIVSAFFTYTGPHFGAPQDEIDFEFLGRDPEAVQLNYFAGGKGGHEKVVRLGFDASRSFNDYAFQWLPDRIRWFVNGRQVHEAIAAQGEAFPHTPGKILLEIWNSRTLTQWLGPYEPPVPPRRQVADFELVAFTAAGEACQFPQSIACRFPLPALPVKAVPPGEAPAPTSAPSTAPPPAPTR